MLKVEVVSAEARLWQGEATRVIARTVEGDIGVLTGHAPTLAILAPGVVRVLTEDGSTVTAECQDGFLSIEHDRVTIVSQDAVLSESGSKQPGTSSGH